MFDVGRAVPSKGRIPLLTRLRPGRRPIADVAELVYAALMSGGGGSIDGCATI